MTRCCATPSIAPQQNTELVCENCGFVFSEVALQQDYFCGTRVDYVEQTHFDEDIKGILHVIGLPISAFDTIDAMMQQVYSRKDYGFGYRGIACAMCMLYFYTRDRRLAVKLKDILSAAGISERLFRSVFNQLKWEHKPARHGLTVELFVPQALNAFGGVLQLDPFACLIQRVVDRASLETGRTSLPLALAIAYHAFIAHGRKDNRKLLNNVSLSLGASLTIVHRRVRELRAVIMDAARKQEMFSDIHVKNYARLLRNVLDFFEVTFDRIDASPTAYKKSEARRAMMQQRINNAKKRILLKEKAKANDEKESDLFSSDTLTKSDAQLDYGDELIEKWIRQGHREEDVLNFVLKKPNLA